MTPVAVAGAACELPGAHSLGELWANVLAQRTAFRAVPPHRLDLSAYTPESAEPSETIACRAAAFVTGYAFPRERYRIPAATFGQVDLAHWLALDVAARAVADAERRTGALPRERTGVIVANTLTGEMSRAHALRYRWPYVRRVVLEALRELPEGTCDAGALLESIEARFKAPFAVPGDETLAGGLANTIAGRIANYFDFGGGAYTVDGACASSLVAIATACAALERDELDVAVVGAVDVSLDPFELVGFSRLGALAADEMRVYSNDPSGFLPGEGAAFVVLRRGAHARALGRIRGVALSSDGAGGITRPELDGQLRVLRRAYASANRDPAEVTLFEGHGTGTAVGDEVELRALRALRGERALEPAYVGSVKALVGHTKAAAGMAGFLKALTALRRGVVPPHRLAGAPHPALDGTLRVTQCALPWPNDRPRLAGVSAFGFGGINAHVVLEAGAPRRPAALARREARQSRTPQDAELILVSAPDGAALDAKLAALAAQVAAMSGAELTDLAVESAAAARDEAHRAALVVARPWAAAETFALARRAAGADAFDDLRAGVHCASARTAPRIALLFPGQASAVRADAGAIGRRFPELDAPFAACPRGDPASTAVAQPAIVAASLAGLDALQRLGVDASVALGHSLGELVALHWAGAFDRASLVALARERGAIMQSTCARGAMAAVAASIGAVRRALRGGAVVACDNAGDRCVVSGEARDVAASAEAARAVGLEVVMLPVTTPFHSPGIEPAREPFRRALAAHALAPPRRPLVSTVHGRGWSSDDDVAATLVRQLVEPVRFREALAAAGRIDLAVEVGAGDTLCSLAARALSGNIVALDVGGESLRGFLSLAGFLYARTGDASAARALAAERYARAPVLDGQRTVFANPCGSAGAPEAPPQRVARAAAAAGAGAPANGERAPAAAAPVFEIARALIARRVELPPETVTARTRLLEDLHLSSLAVGQVIADLAQASGAELPRDLLGFAGATVGEIADALERARAEGPAARGPDAAGVAPWVRRFRVAELPADDAPPAAAAHDWVLHSDSALGPALRARCSAVRGAPRARVLLLADAAPAATARRLLDFVRAVAADPATSLVAFVMHRCGGAAFARSFALEHPELAVFAVTVEDEEVPPAAVCDALLAEATATTGFAETVVREGRRLRRELQLDERPRSARELLGAHDVLLVSGGGKGIGAECAFRRARETGASLVVVGRSAPAADAALAANLARFERAGIRVEYVRADVRDAAALRAGVATAAARCGPITAILHAAGVNEPRALSALTAEQIDETVAIKVDGLRNLLAACEAPQLRELVAFGSIIARTGMRGDAHYALANELLAREADAVARERPGCRVLVAEWSIWSEVGMGDRLGGVDALARLGVAAIPPDAGVGAYLELVRDPDARGAIVLSGRLGAFPTLRSERVPLPLARFLERTIVHVPGVELVVEAALAPGTDPYLGEHRIDGLAVVPGVMLIEAMAQAASALLGAPAGELRDVRFARPVVVADDSPRTIRVAALREGGAVRVELFSDETGFRFAHAAASVHAGTPAAPPRLAARGTARGSLPSAQEVYATILFHRGRFAGLREYHALAARRCVATVRATRLPWFAPALPQLLQLGNAAVRDMAIHVLQACVPEVRVLPAAIGRIARYAGAFPSEVVVDAREVRREGDDYVFDVTLADAGGVPLETISGLVLRRSAAATSRPIPPALVAAAVERRLLDANLGEVALEGFAPPSGERWEHRPDGRPDAGARCYARALELRCTAGAEGIDAEFAGEATAQQWARVTARHDAAARCAAQLGDEPEERVRARVWCALEAAKKAESATPLELTVRDVRADGITLFSTGRGEVATLCVETAPAGEALVVAVALPSRGARASAVAS